MKNKTISSDSHHFIIINNGNIKIHQSWIACYGKEFWDGLKEENTHYLEKCRGKREKINAAKENYGMNKNLPPEFLNELYRIIKSKPTMAEDINNFCDKYCGVPLTGIENGPIEIIFDITYYDFPLCVNKN